MKLSIVGVAILTIVCIGCSKNEPPSSSSSNNSGNSTPGTSTNCSTITAQTSVSSNGVIILLMR
ncbi:MAG: hypothetical protein P8Q14_01250 [Vicingaceae bacterium]|nr:hypothetical protein [Vicingaceae bacterium]